MPLDPQFRAILDTLESSGLLPLIRGDAAQARARYPAMTSASITENDEGYLVVRQCAGLQAGGGGGRT